MCHINASQAATFFPSTMNLDSVIEIIKTNFDVPDHSIENIKMWHQKHAYAGIAIALINANPEKCTRSQVVKITENPLCTPFRTRKAFKKAYPYGTVLKREAKKK